MSMAPFSSRNSERWKPSGSVSRTVCSITRGPAKPMSAPGSAMTTSPMKAKLADTPPIVGSVRIEMNGCFAAVSWCSDAVVLAICMWCRNAFARNVNTMSEPIDSTRASTSSRTGLFAWHSASRKDVKSWAPRSARAACAICVTSSGRWNQPTRPRITAGATGSFRRR